MIAGKVWGETQIVLQTPLVAIHRLRILPNSFCSLHHHEGRWNAFLVIQGRLLVEVKQKDYDLTDVTELCKGDVTTVAPMLPHRFRTESDGAECFEIYYPPTLEIHDIIRKDIGGRNDESCI